MAGEDSSALQLEYSIDAIEDFSDHMERGDEVWTTVSNKEPNGFAYLRLQRVCRCQGPHPAIEDYVLGLKQPGDTCQLRKP